MAIFRQLLNDVRRVCQQIIAIVCGLEFTWYYRPRNHCTVWVTYSSVNIRYTILCHMKYYSRVPFPSYILFTRDYCYVWRSSSTKEVPRLVWFLLSLLHVFPLMAGVFLCVAGRMVRRAQMGYRTCQVINPEATNFIYIWSS